MKLKHINARAEGRILALTAIALGLLAFSLPLVWHEMPPVAVDVALALAAFCAAWALLDFLPPHWTKWIPRKLATLVAAVTAGTVIFFHLKSIPQIPPRQTASFQCPSLPKAPAHTENGADRIFINLTAEQLGKLWFDGGEKAAAAYIGKWLSFSGPMTRINSEIISGETYIFAFVDLGYGCFVATLTFKSTKWEKRLVEMKKGDIISSDCRLRSVGPNMLDLDECELI
jgi:hypothetical protein